jgi:uncharacterized membrane protein YeaQ/YmgE (transglycosylase-associated protein family)
VDESAYQEVADARYRPDHPETPSRSLRARSPSAFEASMNGEEISVLAWLSLGLAFWHGCVFVPDRFLGGITGALAVSLLGAVIGGLLLPTPGIPSENPPGLMAALGPLVGAPVALGVSYAFGRRPSLEESR